MRWMKVLAGIVGVFAIAAIGLVIFVATLDLNAYKAEIEAAVEEATGRRLAIDGDIHLAWTPRPTLTTPSTSPTPPGAADRTWSRSAGWRWLSRSSR